NGLAIGFRQGKKNDGVFRHMVLQFLDRFFRTITRSKYSDCCFHWGTSYSYKPQLATNFRRRPAIVKEKRVLTHLLRTSAGGSFGLTLQKALNARGSFSDVLRQEF